MDKPLLLAALLLASPAVLRADEEDPPAPASGPEAAAAARDKGYRADEPEQTGTAGGAYAPIAPAGPTGDPRVISAPPQRPLGVRAAGPKVAGPGTGSGAGASGGGGISCEKSVPALTGGVARKEIDAVKLGDGRVQNWEVPPNGAISYKFTAPAWGYGTFFATMGTHTRPSPTLMTVSSVPCDFDVEKTRVAATKGGCHQWGPTETGVTWWVGGGKGPSPGCSLKAGQVYYMSLRTLTNPNQENQRDGCVDQFNYIAPQPGTRRTCGGIWKLSGSFGKDPKDDPKKRP